MAAYKGIDVSKWQGTIDWQKVKASGIQFAMIRIAYSTILDKCFETNYKNAKAAGMPIGVYIYTMATDKASAEKEADYLIELLKGKTLEYPVAFDIEDKVQSGLTKTQITAIIKAFCDRMTKAGFYVCIYSSKSWFETKINVSKLASFDIWLAQWNKTCTYKGKYDIWQYSDSGSVAGITGNVDMDYSYKDYAKIIKEACLNGFTKEVAKPVQKPAAKPKLKSIDEIAKEVIDRKWGNSLTRKKKLTEAGYDAAAVQKKVNEILAEQKAAKKHSKGAKVKLNNTPVYKSATDKAASGTKTGTYFIYDGECVNGRYRITTKKTFCGKKPVYQYVTGWIDLK